MRRQESSPAKTSSSLRVPVRRQQLAPGLPFDFTDTGFDTQFNLLMLWTALVSIQNQDLPTAARNASYAVGKFAHRQKFAAIQPLAEEALKATHPLHPRSPDVIRKRAEPLMNAGHRFLSGYRDNSQCERIQDLAMGVVDQIERISRDVLGVWITWFGIDDKMKPTNYWRDEALAEAPAPAPAKPRKRRTGALYGIGAVLAGLLIGFVLRWLEVGTLWQYLGGFLAVLCVLAYPIRLMVTRKPIPLAAARLN